MSTTKTNGIELAKYATELCKCNPGFDMAGLKDLAEKTIESAKIENDKPIKELEIPVYLDKDVEAFFYQKASEKNIDLKQVVDTVLRKEMDLLKVIG